MTCPSYQSVENGCLEYESKYYTYFDDEFWVWDAEENVWLALSSALGFLTAVNGRIALLDHNSGKHFCNCPWIEVYRHGCNCGGV